MTATLRALMTLFLVPAAIGGAPLAHPRLASTPPMGWNSWNQFGSHIDDALIRSEADALVSSGMKSAGYEYVNLDGGWEGVRDSAGVLHPNAGFPDMKALTAYVHSKGLKIGIYSTPGPKSCGGFEGSYGHEDQDAQMFADWGFDLLKYDWCTAGTVYKPEEYPAAIRKMADALAKTGRPILYSVHGRGAVWRYAAQQGAQMWRTGNDIKDNYTSMLSIGFGQEGLEKFAGPGHWNDPDMLEVGNGGMRTSEYQMHMSLWCLLASPLLAGNDLRSMTPESLKILTNRDAIAIDQDPLGIQGSRIMEEGPLVVMAKKLHDGVAVGFFNRQQGVLKETVHFHDLGLPEEVTARDVWSGKDFGIFKQSFSTDVPEHSVVLMIFRPGQKAKEEVDGRKHG